MATNEVTKEQADLLTHTVGAGPHIKRRNHGYRNRFCAEVGSKHYAAMREMERAGLVTSVGAINEGRDVYFMATLAGCEAIGLSKAATKRAMTE